MPAIITHYLFGEEIIARSPNAMGDSRDEVDAFLLGNQGPDVFFFAYMNPTLSSSWGIGSKLHRTSASKILNRLLDAVKELPIEYSGIGYSYVAGMACHFILDSNMHPFVYTQQFAICDAGIEGLDRADGNEVHAEIEKELDMLTLTKLRDRTISTVSPPFPMLPGNDLVLNVISSMYVHALKKLYGIKVSSQAFAGTVKAYRIATHALYSPRGIKSSILGTVERLFRHYSMIESMTHRDEKLEASDFDNREHQEWIDPFTGEPSTASYWDLFNDSLDQAINILKALPDADSSELEHLFNDVDFNGNPLNPTIISIDN